ncbi:hypothetical protein DRN52_07925 [Thermococci archaeon]|nr:MAG: hypothetical protein DRN52_07925 [Thermococci archaeon]
MKGGGGCSNNTDNKKEDKPSYQVQADLDEIAEIESRESVEKAEVVEIPIDDIVVDPEFKREIYDDSMVEELAKSIEQHGLMQPILVRKVRGKYHLICGFRRLNAFIKLGRERIPAKVVDVDEKEAYILHLSENLQRHDLSDWDFMVKVVRAIEDYGFTQPELAEKLGVSQSKISMAWNVWNHGQDYRYRIMAGEISIREVYERLLEEKRKSKRITQSNITCNITESNTHRPPEGLTIEDLKPFEKSRTPRHDTLSRRGLMKICALCGNAASYPNLISIPVCAGECNNYVLKLVERFRPIIRHYRRKNDLYGFEEDLDKWCSEWEEELEERGEVIDDGAQD